MIIRKERKSLVSGRKKAKFLLGPTSANPGPMFERLARTEENNPRKRRLCWKRAMTKRLSRKAEQAIRIKDIMES